MPRVRFQQTAKEAIGFRVERRGRIRPAMLGRAELVRSLWNGRPPFALILFCMRVPVAGAGYFNFESTSHSSKRASQALAGLFCAGLYPKP
jgi:hypothetical protein